MHEEPMRVDAVGRAGHEGAQVFASFDLAALLRLFGRDDLRLIDLVPIGIPKRMQDDDVADSHLVEVVEHMGMLHARMAGEHAAARGSSDGKGA